MATATTRTVPGGPRRRRWPRRVARGTLRVAKGLLALVAAAALVAWPWSYEHAATVSLHRWAVEPARVSVTQWRVGWWAGRTGFSHDLSTFSEEGLDLGRETPARHGPGWRAEVAAVDELRLWENFDSDASWGPLHWVTLSDAPASGSPYGRSAVLFTLPCWLLALAAGAWPAGSAALSVRRRRRLRRLALVGRCRRCGYDLRATPDPAGPRLPACPECGAAAAAVE
jgi:hypothetical protein